MMQTRTKVLIVGVLVIVGIVVGVQLAQRRATTAEVPPAPGSSAPASSAPASSAPASSAPASSAPAAEPRRLTGEALAKAWLTGYLTRPAGRDDPRWKPAISDLTSPELMQLLEARGPNLVGAFKLDRWAVTKIVPFKGKYDVGGSGPSRQVLAYTATITDGKQSLDKPFVLTAYADESGRFIVSMIEQPYTSEG